jgi:hypothetical protein
MVQAAAVLVPTALVESFVPVSAVAESLLDVLLSAVVSLLFDVLLSLAAFPLLPLLPDLRA